MSTEHISDPWVVKCTDSRPGNRVYLAPAGSEKTYTANPMAARRFTRDAAQRQCLGNEIAVRLLDIGQ